MNRWNFGTPPDCAKRSGISGGTAARRFVQFVLTACLISACASLPPGVNVPKTQSSALEHPEHTRLGRIVQRSAHEHKGQSGFRLLPVGMDGFLTRVQMISAAEHTIDVQYFIFSEDETGKLMSDAILHAADQGVRVRILIDDADLSRQASRIEALDAHPRIEIRIFNPFSYRGHVDLFRVIEFMFNASRLDYRMHNKLFVVDNTLALVGGRNIGDKYFQSNSGSQFGDYDVFAAGPVVKRLSATFDEYWKSALSIPVRVLTNASDEDSDTALAQYRKVLDDFHQNVKTDGMGYEKRIVSGEPLAGLLSGRLPLVWAHAQVICDSPEKKLVSEGAMIGKLMHRAVAKAADEVQSELLIVSPYFIPGDEGMRLFKNLRKRNVRVRVLTNSLESTDEFGGLLAYAGYTHYRRRLLKMGVELYEVRPVLAKPKGTGSLRKTVVAGIRRESTGTGSTRRRESEGTGSLHESAGTGQFALHAKVFVFDRKELFVGSMNFDQRSMRLNTEVGLIIDSPRLARQAAERFESIAQPANSYQLALRRDDHDVSRIVWRTQDDGKTVELDREPARDEEQRAKVGFFSLLPLDNEL